MRLFVSSPQAVHSVEALALFAEHNTALMNEGCGIGIGPLSDLRPRGGHTLGVQPRHSGCHGTLATCAPFGGAQVAAGGGADDPAASSAALNSSNISCRIRRVLPR